jgi:hypothetical protein
MRVDQIEIPSAADLPPQNRQNLLGLNRFADEAEVARCHST